MSNLQAALGFGQLKNIKWIVKRKRQIGNRYFLKLKNDKKIILQMNKTNYAENIYWVFGVLIKKGNKLSRDKVMKKLLNLNIETRPFFVSMNKQKIFNKMKLFKNSKVLNSEYLSTNGFYLPSGIGIKNKEIDYVSKCLLKILN